MCPGGVFGRSTTNHARLHWRRFGSDASATMDSIPAALTAFIAGLDVATGGRLARDAGPQGEATSAVSQATPGAAAIAPDPRPQA